MKPEEAWPIFQQAARLQADPAAPPVAAIQPVGPGAFYSTSYAGPRDFTNHYFGQAIHQNQIEIIDAILGDARTSVVVQPRQAGKTSSVAIACAMICQSEGAEWMRTQAEPYRIGIFAPKVAQAQIDIDRLKSWARFTERGRALINWEETTTEKIVWHNGCEVLTFSASEQAENEGKTLNRIFIEEAQNVSDHVVSQIILPMGGATGAKITKIGTVRPIRNHFWRSWHEDPQARKVWHHWLICDNFLRAGYLEYDGRKISKYILDMMPLAHKETYVRAKMFPTTPDFYYPGSMELTDFLTEYELRWLEEMGLFLTADEKARLFSGTHSLQTGQELPTEELYAGIDFATGVGKDETAISVWRRVGQIKLKVFGVTYSTLSLPDQKREIVNLFGRDGRFYRVRRILGDVGGNGLALIEDLATEANLPIEPVNFGASDPAVRGVAMNMKTSMFMDFKREVQNGALRYPKPETPAPMEVSLELKKGVRQWSALEQELRPGTVNRRIQAPESDHDDIPCADVLAIRAAKIGAGPFGLGRGGRVLGAMPELQFVRNSRFR